MPEAETVAGAPPSAVMVQLLGGFQVSQAIYVVTDLGVATILEQEGPKTVAELAERTGAKREPLHRLIRTLAPLGVFTTEGEYVNVTPVGATLSEKHPRSLHGIARMWMETHYLPFSELRHSVRTGQPGSDKYLGKPFFDWIATDPRREVLFSQAMADITSSLRTGMFDGYQLPAGRTVADIGGSDGSVLVELLTLDRDAGRRGILFDRPTTVPAAGPTLAAAGLTDRVEVVAGDFFTEAPAADIYVLSNILHDWDDQSCQRILGNIAAAASPAARLLVIEGVVPDGDQPHLTKVIDLTMLGMVSGKERTEQEYRDLLDSAGFTLDRIVPTPSPFSVLEATPR
jgi:DNA-binding Lrp family transcriptional regulator